MISIAFIPDVPSHNSNFEKINKPFVIEGVEVYETLCPISKLTGCRENPLALLKSLVSDPAKGRLLDSILMELPSIDNPKSLTPDDVFEQLKPVLQGSAFFDNDKFGERLMAISEDLLKTVGIEQKISKVENVSPEPSSEPAVQ